jgi:hypothetical protein
MAKGQKRSGREPKKPKLKKEKPSANAGSTASLFAEKPNVNLSAGKRRQVPA